MHMAIMEAFEELVKSGAQFTGDEGAAQWGSEIEPNGEAEETGELVESPMKNENEEPEKTSEDDEFNNESEDLSDEVPPPLRHANHVFQMAGWLRWLSRTRAQGAVGETPWSRTK